MSIVTINMNYESITYGRVQMLIQKETRQINLTRLLESFGYGLSDLNDLCTKYIQDNPFGYIRIRDKELSAVLDGYYVNAVDICFFTRFLDEQDNLQGLQIADTVEKMLKAYEYHIHVKKEKQLPLVGSFIDKDDYVFV